MGEMQTTEIVVNGEQQTLTGEPRLTRLVESLGLEGQRIAIEVNEELVPRSALAKYRLNTGDRVEIVRAIGGG